MMPATQSAVLEPSASPAPDPTLALTTGRTLAAALAAETAGERRSTLARQFIHAVIARYWRQINDSYSTPWPLPELELPEALEPLPPPAQALATGLGEAAAALDPVAAGYRIGLIYTAMLPPEIRARWGVYYTPPPLVERLLGLATTTGLDWTACRVLDPACGGGAFLAPVAQRMTAALGACEPRRLIQSVTARLQGLEIDPFAAWMSQVFLEATLLAPCRAAGQRLPRLVEVCDALAQTPDRTGFDLVIGNPPYGRVTLTPVQRKHYRRSLYGHANLYGVFTDLAIRQARPGGIIAYVTPASFLAGEYFKALRTVLAQLAPPAAINFVVERKGVFDDVLQETVLTVYRRSAEPAASPVHCLTLEPQGLRATAAGAFVLPADPGAPWLIPRNPDQAELIERLRTMPHRLRDYGYTVSTGPLVWNRHKPQLRDQSGDGCYPIVWAEAVSADGFTLRAEKRNHRPFIRLEPGQQWLITRTPCVLLQRTTAKEQHRRLIAAALPEAVLACYGAVAVENHLNMIRPIGETPPALPPALMAALLNTPIVDQAFRCLNGSVAVSAYELEALPLPPPSALAHWTAPLDEMDNNAFAAVVEALYWNR